MKHLIDEHILQRYGWCTTHQYGLLDSLLQVLVRVVHQQLPYDRFGTYGAYELIHITHQQKDLPREITLNLIQRLHVHRQLEQDVRTLLLHTVTVKLYPPKIYP